MRKHPLIALTAFTALTASAIAGASTGSFQSSSVLTSARTPPASSSSAARATASAYDAEVAYSAPVVGPDLSFVHDASRPPHERVNPRTGLPRAARHARRAAPSAVEAVSELPVTPVPDPVVTTTTPPATIPPATVPATTAAPTIAPTAPAGGVWYELRLCESGDNYSEDTGNGYYGAYQFSLATWYGLGLSGLPSDASPATQDEAAQELETEYGWGQWPGCAAQLGL
ncbi:MAG TPA: transglycosylase family protein [Acidimicrobiales bacterium]|nr:transglycosylase family protein [Acidimicrobiales bacterium]